MRIQSALTRFLFRILPEGERQQMVNDLITWLNPNLPCVQQKEIITDLRPHLLNLIREGRIGLWLLIYHHLMRFFNSRRRKSNISPEVPPHFKSA